MALDLSENIGSASVLAEDVPRLRKSDVAT
jgi:hypothetical protein